MKLTAADFSAFFSAIHGYPPFPWQQRLAGLVLNGPWPRSLALPTASGKTAILDVAVFALAAQACLPVGERTACRRIALVVDRRIVVDDAYRRAQTIRQHLADAREGILRHVSEALLSLGGESPLEAASLRGGIYREDRWARTPSQPVILCSTVDQVGSRLLHRGYGLSSSVWPIHGGLFGNDCLIVLDEAHCSRPFLQTLGWIERFRAQTEIPSSLPFSVVAMTATPQGDLSPFCLDKEDRKNQQMHRRLAAQKRAILVVAKEAKGDSLSETWIEELRRILSDASVRALLVVVNRVSTARQIREELAKLAESKKDPIDADSILLTGRCRAVDRDALLQHWRGRIMAGRDRAAQGGARPLVVVATQCVEVGADLDADALITEACPLDALRQRLGRLDRLGERGRSQVVVVCRPEYAEKPDSSAEDPIYGEALSRAWHWLKGKAPEDNLDLGIDALDGCLPTDLSSYSSPALDAPVMFPAYCDLWVQTGPEPAVSPDPAIFLHGPKRGAAEVSVVWRADLAEGHEDSWGDTVACCPPVAAESLPLPYHIAKRWLVGDSEDAGGDAAEATPEEVLNPGKPMQAPRMVLRWRGPESAKVVGPNELRPGDVLVVPCSYGGCDGEGWNPDSGLVSDIAERAAIAARRRAVLRLHPSLLTAWGSAANDNIRQLAETSGEEWPDDIRDRVANALDALADCSDLSDNIRPLVGVLRSDRKFGIEPHPSGIGLLVRTRKRLGGKTAGGDDFTDEDATSGLADRSVTLPQHLADVEARARSIARSAGLGTALVADLALAARLHDIGKADPRFQAWLAAGDRILAARQGLLAKSGRFPMSGRAIAAARRKAGYPEGGRHELLSVRLAESAPDLLERAKDRELVLHLVASHHGHCRPFAPVIFDGRPLEVDFDYDGTRLHASSDTGLESLDSGVAERFWRLVCRYGWWGLSHLEACLRLADHRASEDPGGEDAS